MKRRHFLAAMLLMAVAVQAQQAIFERHDTRSPQFNDDGTVTLCVKPHLAQLAHLPLEVRTKAVPVIWDRSQSLLS